MTRESIARPPCRCIGAKVIPIPRILRKVQKEDAPVAHRGRREAFQNWRSFKKALAYPAPAKRGFFVRAKLTSAPVALCSISWKTNSDTATLLPRFLLETSFHYIYPRTALNNAHGPFFLRRFLLPRVVR